MNQTKIIIRLQGGLGNQMFQYAFAKKLEKQYGLKVLLDDSFYKQASKVKITQYNSIDNFDVSYCRAEAEDLKKVCFFSHNQRPMSFCYRVMMLLEKIFNRGYYHDGDRRYISPDKLIRYKYLDGYWQSYLYLKGIEEEVRKSFVYKGQLSPIIEEQIECVKKQDSIFIGIRRGDYIANKANIRRYGELNENYYNKAILYIKEKVSNPVFYVMSDDIEWVKENIFFCTEVVYRDEKNIGNAYEELMFMASCKHAIIPNSTYHWWGAWLINNDNKIVVAPENWFADGSEIDIICDEWIKVKR